jgi:hypothetical protein
MLIPDPNIAARNSRFALQKPNPETLQRCVFFMPGENRNKTAILQEAAKTYQKGLYFDGKHLTPFPPQPPFPRIRRADKIPRLVLYCSYIISNDMESCN